MTNEERAIDLVKVCKAGGNFEENLPLFIAEIFVENAQLKAKFAVAERTVSFFASVIKSGESWSSECDSALAKLKETP